MKRIRNIILSLVLVSLGGLLLVSCGSGGGGGGGGDASSYSLLGLISTYKILTIVRNGSINFSNLLMPITGEAVTNASVTVSNESTGSSEIWTYKSNGTYSGQQGVPVTAAGENATLRVVIDSDTISGSSTLTPNPMYTNLTPTFSTIPVTISWSVSYFPPTYEATHTWFTIASSTEGYQAVLPISQTSIQLTSAEVSPGTYSISVVGVNPMNLSGAKSGSMVYVAGGVPGTSGLVIY